MSKYNQNHRTGHKENLFKFLEATTEDNNRIIRKLNPNNDTGPDRIPIKVIKHVY